MYSVSVCIPAYNEGPTLAAAVTRMEAVLEQLGCDYEIIVCDDASHDDTGDVLRQLTQEKPRRRAIFHPVNRGIYATFEELYASATKDAIFLLPSDMEWPPETLSVLLPYLSEADIIVAVRRDKHYGFFRAFVSFVFNLVPRLLFGVRTDDAGAVKLVRAEVIQKIPLISKSPFSEAERIVRAVRTGYRLKTIPTVTRKRSAGVSHGIRFGVLLSSLADCGRVWWDIRSRGDRFNQN